MCKNWLAKHHIEILDYLDRQVEVPVLPGLQAQGDVLIVPASIAGTGNATTPVPAGGIPVVRGESGGNTHTLVAEGECFFDPATASATSLALGILTVGDGGCAYLCHPEHSYAGIAPGSYELRRQREQADQIRIVSD